MPSDDAGVQDSDDGVLSIARCLIRRQGIRPMSRTTAPEAPMCRNIRTLYNFEPPATQDEIRASALQFVRKLSGFNTPSKANEAAFEQAVAQVTDAARTLIDSLIAVVPPKNREVERAKAMALS